MNLTSYPTDKLAYSPLFHTYLNDFSRLQAFYRCNPFDPEAIAEVADAIPQLSADRRKQLSELLRTWNERFDSSPETFENIDRLKEKDALVIVTGQQLGLYGGPLFTVFKTVTVIHLARRLQKSLGRPVIPLFWLADEDHDYEEVRRNVLLDRDEPEEVALPPRIHSSSPVSDVTLPEELDVVRSRAAEIMGETDFSAELWERLDRSYRPGVSYGQAFGDLLAGIFGGEGLVLAGSNWQPVKEHASEVLKQSVEQADAIRSALEKQSGKLGKAFHRQAAVQDSNLFHLDGKGQRVKITRNGDGWKTESGTVWRTGELTEAIDAHPERFSPNVFLRPILQDALLPTLGYVAGPGEIAYYGQMKEMYRCFGQTMPVIFPRLTGTVIEPSIDRILEDLPFDIHEYGKRIEDLESDYLDRTDQVDIEAIFSSWKESVGPVIDEHTEEIREIDPTLEGAAGKVTSAYYSELDKLKGKVYRSVKQREQTQLNRIRKIQAHLFPGGELQERTIGWIHFLNKYGPDFCSRLLDAMEGDEPFDHHKLIRI